MSRPLLSVVMPLHDHATTVEAAVQSVLCQGYEPLEAIVVDDGSSDDGPDRVRRIGGPVSLTRQPRLGAGAARNRGWRLARGDLAVFLDADDLLEPGCLERHAAALSSDDRLDGVYGDVLPFTDPPVGGAGETRPGRMPGSMMLRRRALGPATLFEDGLRQVEVVEWVARLEEAGVRLAHVPGIALRRRIHPGNHGHATDRVEYARVIKRVLDRRRAAAET